MKLLHILFGVMFCLASVSGRNLQENTRNDEYTENDPEKPIRDPTANQMRHRRRLRQSFYDYNYHDYRRDYSRQQDETYNQILGYLEEIAHNVRRTPPPPSPPQPIYIPYPVPYYVPQYMNRNIKGQPEASFDAPIIGTTLNRWPIIEDENQIFGVDAGVVDTGNSDGSRPINLDPVPPSVHLNESPKVDDGTTQAGVSLLKMEEPKFEMKKPSICKAVILTCCNLSEAEQRSCFNEYNCLRTYETGLACRPEVLNKVLEEFSKTYASINRL